MKNQIYLRIGRPKRFEVEKKEKKMNPLVYFVLKWAIILGFIYFFLGDFLSGILN